MPPPSDKSDKEKLLRPEADLMEHPEAATAQVCEQGEGADAPFRPVAQRDPGYLDALLSAPDVASHAAKSGKKAGTGPEIDSPVAGINLPGFIDHSDGANLRNRPAELPGSHTLINAPLLPATRVFVSGRHPDAPDWWYVTAFINGQLHRGYVQHLRITTDLPEPGAELYQIQLGDTVENLAVRKFKGAISDGHDLRFYENVLFQVNARERNRDGIRGWFQDPGLLGGGNNNLQLEAGKRIWLVTAEYAHALEGSVPDGSFSNGVYAKVKRFAQHIHDIVDSVYESPGHFGSVAAEYAQAIRDHMAEIIGIVAAFIFAEAASAFLAATPTGVGQIAAMVIQLALAAFGAAGMVTAGVEAIKHAESWLSISWQAKGRAPDITVASIEFLKMLVSIALAALSYTGAKANLGKAVKLADSVPLPTPTFVTPEGVAVPATDAAPVAISPAPSPGSAGTGMAMTMKGEGGGQVEASESSSAEPEAKSKKPRYEPNPAHKPRANPNKTPEPPDAEEVYERAVDTGDGKYYGIGSNGEIYRFFSDNTGGAHFSGTTGKGGIPLDKIPIEVRRAFGRVR